MSNITDHKTLTLKIPAGTSLDEIKGVLYDYLYEKWVTSKDIELVFEIKPKEEFCEKYDVAPEDFQMLHKQFQER